MGARSRRRMVVGAVAAVVLGASFLLVVDAEVRSRPAGAQVEPRVSGGRGTIIDGVPEAIVIVSDERTIVRWESSSRGGPRWVCGYHAIVAPMQSVYDPSPVVDWLHRVVPVPGRDYMLACFVGEDDSRTMVRSRYVVYDQRDEFSGLAETERAVDEARRRLPLPHPDPFVNPPTEQLVGLPMWMWLERPWERITAVASIRDVWAAVAARPIASHWVFADGTEEWCDQGVAYDLSRSPRDQWSNCTHTFQHSSSTSVGGVEWVRVTMVWKVEWYATDIGGQPLGTVERSTEFPVRVVEAQAVVR